jgi:two-component system alkaline phosphatase synthesis response regulator PhoP
LIRADQETLGRAIWNLLDNAEKYSPECPTIRVDVEREGAGVAIRVQDHGLGIPEAEQRDIRRARVRTPIIILTAKTHEAEKILGLDLGADDYVTKPFSPRELRSRIRALLRRAAEPAEETFRFGDVEIDFARGELRRHGTPVELTPIEFKLLDVFVRNRGRVLSRERLIQDAWGGATFVTERAVDGHIVCLRRKIEEDPVRPRHLVSVRGLGYRLDA